MNLDKAPFRRKMYTRDSLDEVATMIEGGLAETMEDVTPLKYVWAMTRLELYKDTLELFQQRHSGRMDTLKVMRLNRLAAQVKDAISTVANAIPNAQ